MLARLASALTHFCIRWVPDAYVIAGLLLAGVLVTAWAFGSAGPLELFWIWGQSFWNFIPFTLQMVMVILTGFVVADAPVSRRALQRLATWPATPRAAVALSAMVSMGLAWVNWGLSIVASALLARRIAARRLGVDFRLLIATAYLGLGCMWHAGLSASAPLTSSDPNQKFVTDYLGGPVPVTQTVFSSFNLLLSATVFLVMTALSTFMQPRRAITGLRDQIDEDEPQPAFARPDSPATWLERTPWINLLLAGCVATYLSLFIGRAGLKAVTINHINLTFLGIGALLHWTPASLLGSAERGGKYVWGVLLQFGLYAGVSGVLDKSGLADRIAAGFTRASSPRTFPLLVVWYSGVLNYLVPSGGAKWLIEVQYLADAARRIGVSMDRTLVAYAWGDMLTDIIQPFWAIPLLAVARLGFRDIMGYCLMFFLAYASLVSAAFFLWGFL